MIEIVSWNIPAGLGCDGKVDLDRIAATIRALSDPDLICLQEVARHMPDVDGGAGSDQAAHLSSCFPDHQAAFGPALDREGKTPGTRAQFGNLVLSRVPVLQIFRHLLPQPAAGGVQHMVRQATEVVVALPSGALRVIGTHLEAWVAAQRDAQIGRLRGLQQEVSDNLAEPPLDPGTGPYQAVPRPASAVICGDFNLTPEAPQYERLQGPMARDGLEFRDAWRARYGDRPHEPTCGVFDQIHWPQGPHCRDYFFVTQDLLERIEVVEVDLETDASDHQPLKLSLRA